MGKIAFLFAGQGAQSVGMGKDLYDTVPEAKAVFDLGEGIRPGTLKTCFEGPGEELTRTKNTQPCLFLTDLACARALEARGIHADFMAGFSLGEVAALADSGVLSDEDAFRVVTLRGETMEKCAEEHPGGMAAVLKLPREKVEEICASFANMYPVNYNCPGQIACAGSREELDAFCDKVKAEGGRAVKLAVSGGFHTPYMKKTTEALREKLEGLDVHAPKTPLYSNRTGDLYPDTKDEIVKLFSEQASHSVYWEDTVRNLYSKGVDTFIEVGAGHTLQGLVKKTLQDVTVLGVSDAETLEKTVEALKK